MATSMSVVSDDAMRYVMKRIIRKKKGDVIRVCKMADNLFDYTQGSTAAEFGIREAEVNKKK